MSRTAQFESSGLKNKASKNRKPTPQLPDLMDFNEDLDELLEGEIDTEQHTARPTPTGSTKSPRQKPVPRPAKTARAKKPQRSALKQTTKTTKKKPQRSAPRQTTSHSRLPQRKSPSHDLKATAAPLLVTVGLLLLIPAFWSVLLLAGVGVPGSAREDSRPMAAVMLACWPIAICLIITAVVFFKQMARAKKELKRVRARA